MWTHHWSFENGKEKNDYSKLSTEKVIDVEYQTELGKRWAGWGTQLKPAYEPIIIARKPIENNIIDNIIKYGVGGINIDECRVPFEDTPNPATNPLYRLQANYKLPEKQLKSNGVVGFTSSKNDTNINGRFPANVIHDGSDEAISGMPYTKSTYNDNGTHEEKIHRGNADVLKYGYKERIDSGFNDSGSVARYFYCAKASKFDRDEGLDEFESKKSGGMIANIGNTMQLGGASLNGTPKEIQPKKNTHTTVKPTELMRYLVRLVAPKGATILDCFNGSGSTGKAVMLENKQFNKDYKYIGIELTDEYLPISKARIEYICNNDFDFYEEDGKPQRQVKDKNVMTLFDLE